MRIKETKIYTYAELSERAKEKARDWYREGNAGDNDWAEFVTDDFLETLKAFGFDVMQRERHPVPGTRARVRNTIQWSGFSSQGDGAAFSGTWSAADFAPDKLLADRPITYLVAARAREISKENAELHRIAGELRACVDAGLIGASIGASIGVSNWGFHMSMHGADHVEPDRDTEPTTDECNALHAAQVKTEERFIEAARDLAHGFYRALEAEYYYQNSDECVAETIVANEYEFTEEGECA